MENLKKSPIVKCRKNVGVNPRRQAHRFPVRPPLGLEKYKQFKFYGIHDYPNPIPNEIKEKIPKFQCKNDITIEDH